MSDGRRLRGARGLAVESRRKARLDDSRLAILPDTTHITLMEKSATLIPMINDVLDAKIAK